LLKHPKPFSSQERGFSFSAAENTSPVVIRIVPHNMQNLLVIGADP
jgi:hypothetical protein